MTERGRIHEPTGLPVSVDAGDDDLEQTDTHPGTWPAIAVSVEGIARVRSLPARRMQTGSLSIAPGGVPHMLLGRSDQRQSVCIYNVDKPITFYADQPAAGSTAGFLLPAGASIGVDYSGPIWVINSDPTAPTTVSWYLTFVEE